MKVLVIGAGWAGLAAAVRAVQRGARVTVWEMAPQAGGRARSWTERDGFVMDSGQHILIGAYTATLELMRTVGVDPDRLLQRLPLTLVNPKGEGLRWGSGGVLRAGSAAVFGHPGWGWTERFGLARWALPLALQGFQCPGDWSVSRLCEDLPLKVRDELIEPLCVAALNTRMAEADARVFLRVLKDALLGGPGSLDLLLPRGPLQSLLPDPALTWLQAQGAQIELGRRAGTLAGEGRCDDWHGDAVIVATSGSEAQRLLQPLAPGWSAMPRSEAIATVYLRSHRPVNLAAPMVALRGAPAQFLFDLGDNRFAAVASAVAADLESGLEPLAQAIEAQVGAQVPALASAMRLRAHADRRATFACTVGVARPPAAVMPGLWAAGDYVAGPYPATLEGAVRSGLQAADMATQ